MNIEATDQVPVSKSLWADIPTFRDNFDRTPFLFSHSLSSHPLFEIPRLLQLAQMVKRDANNVVYDAGRSTSRTDGT